MGSQSRAELDYDRQVRRSIVRKGDLGTGSLLRIVAACYLEVQTHRSSFGISRAQRTPISAACIGRLVPSKSEHSNWTSSWDHTADSPQVTVLPPFRHNPSLILPFRLPGLPILLIRPHSQDLRQPNPHTLRFLRPDLRHLLPRSLPNRKPSASSLRNATSRHQARRPTHGRECSLARRSRRRRTFRRLEPTGRPHPRKRRRGRHSPALGRPPQRRQPGRPGPGGLGGCVG